jgi:hypothetical protein
MLKRVLAVGLVLCCVPRYAHATPIVWDFEGEINGSVIPEFPDSTPVRIEWRFDSNQPNRCGPGDPGGLYFGMEATVTLGAYTWESSGFFIDGLFNDPCRSLSPDRELRLTTWTGPVLPSGWHIDFVGPMSGGLFWQQPPDNGLPTTPPPTTFFDSNPFIGGGPRPTVVTSTVHFVPVPEPTTVTLVAVGCGLGASFRRRRSGGTRSVVSRRRVVPRRML